MDEFFLIQIWLLDLYNCHIMIVNLYFDDNCVIWATFYLQNYLIDNTMGFYKSMNNYLNLLKTSCWCSHQSEEMAILFDDDFNLYTILANNFLISKPHTKTYRYISKN